MILEVLALSALNVQIYSLQGTRHYTATKHAIVSPNRVAKIKNASHLSVSCYYDYL